MIPAGTCFCPQCGRTFREAFYKDSLNSWGVLLDRTLRGYELTPHNNRGNLSDAVPVRLAQKPLEPTPDYIEVLLPDSDEPQHWARSCPHCNVHTQIPGDAGKVPTYVILLAGNPDAGKSSLSFTMGRVDVLAPFNRMFGSRYILDAYQYNDRENAMVKNMGRDLAESGWLYLKDRETEEVKAMILLRDLAGELYSATKKSELIPYFAPKKGYRPDGIMFVTPYRDQSCIGAFNSIKPYIDRNIPVAFVATFLDELQRDKSYEKTRARNGETVRLGLSALQPMIGRMDEPTTRRRIALENLLFLRLAEQRKGSSGKPELRASSLSSLLSMRQGSASAGFLVQPCFPELNERKEVASWHDSQNALDPLIWMLTEFGLFRWSTTGGHSDD